jgi:tetratricopeptide (TPR) repeat protein
MTRSQEKISVRSWILFGSGLIVVFLFFSLLDFSNPPEKSLKDGSTHEDSMDPGPNLAQVEPSTLNKKTIEDSSKKPDGVSIPDTGRDGDETEIEQLLERIISTPEIDVDVLENVDTETALKLINIASSLADFYQYEAGIPWAQDAVRLDPGLPDAHLMSGYLYFKLVMTDEAIAAFEKTIELDPLNFDAHFYLGRIYNGNDQPNLGMEYLTRAIEIATTPEDVSLGFAYRALSHALLDQYDKALKDLENALYLNPDNGWAVFFRGKIMEEMELKEKEVLEKEGVPGDRIGVTP